MSTLIRLWEKLTLKPHRTDLSERVAVAADELTAETRALSDQLQPYIDSGDPLTAIMFDLYAKRRRLDAESQSGS
jgi:hypothetical protein